MQTLMLNKNYLHAKRNWTSVEQGRKTNKNMQTTQQTYKDEKHSSITWNLSSFKDINTQYIYSSSLPARNPWLFRITGLTHLCFKENVDRSTKTDKNT